MSIIRDTLLLQKRELERNLKEKYVERKVKFHINDDMIRIIIGPRRAGKSFFAIHALNKISESHFGYVNFDDEKLVEVKDYDDIINTINSVYNNPGSILFDEIQNLEKWELFVNRLQRQGYRLIITGSNSKLLSAELATHLTGRHLQITIFPFSFKEFLDVENKELTEGEIKEKLHSYITYGGYPEPTVKKINIKDYLSTLLDSTIYKDIIKRHKIRNPQAIEDLVFYLLSNISNEFSYNTLSKVTKCKSVHTIEKYLGYLEEAFIFFRVKAFSFKAKEQITRNKKIYSIDNGFVYSKGYQFKDDFGKLYENIVAIELKKLEMNNIANIYYWKNSLQEEVDFVVKRGIKIEQLIQVCYNIENAETKKREIRALIKASEELRCPNLVIIGNEDKEEEVEWFGTKRKIKFISLWKWLLENNDSEN